MRDVSRAEGSCWAAVVVPDACTPITKNTRMSRAECKQTVLSGGKYLSLFVNGSYLRGVARAEGAGCGAQGRGAPSRPPVIIHEIVLQ